MSSIESALQSGNEVVWIYRGVYGKRIKTYGVTLGTIHRKLRTFRLGSEAESVRTLDQLKAALPHASVGWDSDAYVQFRFKDPARLRGRAIDVDDYDTGFRGFLLWRLLKPILIPLLVLAVVLFVLTRPAVMGRILALWATPGSDEYLQLVIRVTNILPPDYVAVGGLILLAVTAWVGILGWVDRSKGRLA